MTRRCVTLATAAMMLAARSARADEPVLGGQVSLGTGIEGGEAGDNSGTLLRRARTRLAAAVDVRSSADRAQAFMVVGFAEVEPHTSFGGELRYLRALGARFDGFLGVTGTLAPHVLYGADVGARFHVPIGRTMSAFFEPSFSVIPFGTDLPSDKPIFWTLFSFGVRADLVSPQAARPGDG